MSQPLPQEVLPPDFFVVILKVVLMEPVTQPDCFLNLKLVCWILAWNITFSGEAVSTCAFVVMTSKYGSLIPNPQKPIDFRIQNNLLDFREVIWLVTLCIT